MLAGVCGGLASYFEIHPAFYRVGFVVLTLLGGAGIIIYSRPRSSCPTRARRTRSPPRRSADRRDRPWPLIGLGLLAVGGAVLLSHATLWPHGDAWIVLLIVGGAILWVTRHEAEADRGARRRDGSSRPRGLASHPPRSSARSRIAFGRSSRCVLVAAAIFAAVVHVHLGRGVGDRTYTSRDTRTYVTTTSSASATCASTWRRRASRRRDARVNARVDVGSLTVIVPRDVALQVHGDAQFGSVDLLGNTRGRAQRRPERRRRTAARVLVLDAHVGAGKLRVERAVR